MTTKPFKKSGQTIRSKIVAVCAFLSLVALSGCTGKVVSPFDIGGSKADGTVIMGSTIGEFDEIDWTGADEMAMQRCTAWGYSNAEGFSGFRTVCVQTGGWFGCAKREVSRTYQCLD